LRRTSRPPKTHSGWTIPRSAPTRRCYATSFWPPPSGHLLLAMAALAMAALAMAALAVVAITAAHARQATFAPTPPPPTSPYDIPPADTGLIPLTVVEVKRLTNLLTRNWHDLQHDLRWHLWRRCQQARARWFHQRTRLARR
jgi:hypothetical protein